MAILGRETFHDGRLPVLHARRDAREQNVALAELLVALTSTAETSVGELIIPNLSSTAAIGTNETETASSRRVGAGLITATSPRLRSKRSKAGHDDDGSGGCL
jgi:hypothetical protein